MNNTTIIEILKLVWPLLVLQLSMQIYALIHLFKTKQTKNLSPAIWGIIIIIGEIIGPVLYFLIGKVDENGSSHS